MMPSNPSAAKRYAPSFHTCAKFFCGSAMDVDVDVAGRSSICVVHQRPSMLGFFKLCIALRNVTESDVIMIARLRFSVVRR